MYQFFTLNLRPIDNRTEGVWYSLYARKLLLPNKSQNRLQVAPSSRLKEVETIQTSKSLSSNQKQPLPSFAMKFLATEAEKELTFLTNS
jgi:hypothetical protein